MIPEFVAPAGIGLIAGLSVREGALVVLARFRRKKRRQAGNIDKSSHQKIWTAGRLVADALPGKWLEILVRAWGESARKQAAAAGRRDIESADVIGLRLILIVGAFVFGLTWFGLGRAGLAAGLIGACLLPTIPGRWLAGEAEKRRRLFARLLPELTELSAIGVEAGLSFDRSIGLYCEQFKNPITDVFSQVLDEMALGKSRRRALEAATGENQVEDFTALVQAVLRAERLGAPLVAVLREQARTGRERHAELARELSATAPVKMLGPIAGLILPALMIVIIGPALLRFM